MNWIEFNDIDSRNITGLLIQSLPPISKPRMRYQVEEIDGRDGDIVTKLGYASYDKEVLIGLHGNYDIDTVIQFFANESYDKRIIFSNEPNKVYKGVVLEQIDFERLIRFKQAVVKFHVQPYKYSNIQSESTWTTTTTSTRECYNYGNVESAPSYRIIGDGVINVRINNQLVGTVDLTDVGDITVDAFLLEAYTQFPENLCNRKVNIDYNALKLWVGSNNIRFTTTSGATFTEATITDFSRWI